MASQITWLNSNSKLTTSQNEVGCLKHPGPSTIGSQILDRDRFHGWQFLATQKPHAEGKADTPHAHKPVERERGNRGIAFDKCFMFKNRSLHVYR